MLERPASATTAGECGTSLTRRTQTDDERRPTRDLKILRAEAITFYSSLNRRASYFHRPLIVFYLPQEVLAYSPPRYPNMGRKIARIFHIYLDLCWDIGQYFQNFSCTRGEERRDLGKQKRVERVTMNNSPITLVWGGDKLEMGSKIWDERMEGEVVPFSLRMVANWIKTFHFLSWRREIALSKNWWTSCLAFS